MAGTDPPGADPSMKFSAGRTATAHIFHTTTLAIALSLGRGELGIHYAERTQNLITLRSADEGCDKGCHKGHGGHERTPPNSDEAKGLGP